ALRGAPRDPPPEEIDRDLGIAGVRLAEVHDDVVVERRALLDVIAAGVVVAHGVELDVDVDGARRADLLQLLDVGEAEALEVVVPGHPDEDGPLLLLRHGGPPAAASTRDARDAACTAQDKILSSAKRQAKRGWSASLRTTPPNAPFVSATTTSPSRRSSSTAADTAA